MRRVAQEVFHLATFHQFKPAATERSPSALNKPFYFLYLLVSHATLLAKRDIDRAHKERAYADKSYDDKAHQVQQQFKKMLPALKAGQRMSTAKDTTHQFSSHVMKPQLRLDSRFLNKARIDVDGCFIDVDANMTFGDLMRYAHKAGYRVPLVPEFLNITAGGAFVGVAIESSGHKFGLFHEHVLQAEVLMPDGELKTVSLKQDADIFNMLPNSNGTLGRVMRLRLPLIPLKSAHPEQPCHPFLDPERKQAYLEAPEPAWLAHEHLPTTHRNVDAQDMVQLRYHRFDRLDPALDAFWQSAEAKDADFVEAVMLDADRVVVVVGTLTDGIRHIPFEKRHNYQTRDVFWQHVNDPAMRENFAPLLDYYARWHQTVFWNTQQLGPLTKLMNSPVFRKVLGHHMGPGFLAMLSNAHTMWQQMFNPLALSQAKRYEHMVQDMGIPKSKVGEFAEIYRSEIGLYPVWLCPVKQTDGRFPGFHAKAEEPFLDWGMFTGKGKEAIPRQPWFYNNMLEKTIARMGGIKALYSDNAFDADNADESERAAGRASFNALYNIEQYDAMKARLDPEGVYPHVFDKMVTTQHQVQGRRAPHQAKLPFSFDAFMLWAQCIGVSTLTAVVAAYCLGRPKASAAASGMLAGVVATQASRLIGAITHIQPQAAMRMARGVSAGSSVASLALLVLLLRGGRSGQVATLATAMLAAMSMAYVSNGVEQAQRHFSSVPGAR